MKKSLFIIIAVAALCIVLLVSAAKKKMPAEIDIGTQSFSKIEGFEEMVYFPISFDERKEFGIIGEDEIGLTEENTYKITEKDIGDFMGIVTESGDDVFGNNVYHFSKYPESDRICIIETPESFEFYVGYVSKSLEPGEKFDVISKILGFPENLEKIEVKYSWGKTEFEITEESEIKQVFEILSGKESLGEEEQNRRMANLFFETYGNEDFIFDEETGKCLEKEKGPVSYINKNGKKVSGGSPAVLARKLLLEKSCGIILTSKNGFEIYAEYLPAVNMIWARGYFELSESETETLNKIFKLE